MTGWLKPLGKSHGGSINTHCFNGGWNPRVMLAESVNLKVRDQQKLHSGKLT